MRQSLWQRLLVAMCARWPGIAPSTFPDSGEISPPWRNQARAFRNHPKRGSAKSPCAPIWMIRHPINSGSSPDEPVRLTFGQPSCRHHHVWRHRSDRHGCSGTPPAQEARSKALRGPFAVATLRLCRNAGGSHSSGRAGQCMREAIPATLIRPTRPRALPVRGASLIKSLNDLERVPTMRALGSWAWAWASNRLPGLS